MTNFTRKKTSSPRGFFPGTLLLLSLLTLFSCKQPITESTSLPRSTPEAEGVSSQSIIDFLDAVETSGQELHSFMYLRNGKVIAEGWWDPYKPELKHTLYSTSKSFTSTAVGFAVSEGLLAVDDKVISFFPDQLPDTVSENLSNMSVKNLLTMSAGQDPELQLASMQPGESWVTRFLAHPVPNPPGSVFLYNSVATYMLSAIVTKVTGLSVLEYLQPRLFGPLHIEGIDWETDPEGITSGGWGLRLKTEDMAKFGQLYLQRGKWNGEQLIPEAWIEEATSQQIDQAPGLPQAERNHDWVQGYGYKFWRSRHNSYRADGAFGQLIMIFPEKNAVLAVTAEASDMQKEMNLVWDHLLPGMSDQKLNPDEATHTLLRTKISHLALAPPVSGSNQALRETITGKKFIFAAPGPEESWIFGFDGDKCYVTQTSADGARHLIALGAGHWEMGQTSIPGPNLLPFYPANEDILLPAVIASAFSWEDDNSLKLTIRYIESPHTAYYTFRFGDQEVTMKKTASMGLYRNLPEWKGQWPE